MFYFHLFTSFKKILTFLIKETKKSYTVDLIEALFVR